MKNQPIGILDSGVGGLSIWKEIVLKLPNESTIYLADSLNCPYGEKTPQEIYVLAKRLVNFLLDQKVKLIVLACNTITVFCIDKLRADFPDIPIVGTVPVVKSASEQTRNKKIGILSTIATSKSKYQKNLIGKFAKDCVVVNIGTEELVPLVEKGEINGAKVQRSLKKILNEFVVKGVDTIALGCSHFPFLKDKIQNIMGKGVMVLDSSGAIARQARRVLTNNNSLSLSKNTSHEFYTTGDANKFIKVSKKLMEHRLKELIKSIQSVSL